MEWYPPAPVPLSGFIEQSEIFLGVNTMARQVPPPHFSKIRNHRSPTTKNGVLEKYKTQGQQEHELPCKQK